MLIGFRLIKTVLTAHLFHFLMHFQWNFAFKFLGSVHNWKQKYNQNIVRKAEIKDSGAWQEAGNTENLAESVLPRLSGQGGLESYISNQIAGCFTSQTKQLAFQSFPSLFCILLFIPFPSVQNNLSIFQEKEKSTPLTQNLWNKHLTGTHCCWLVFRWCICRADHQSNSRLQLVHCCSDSCFYKKIAYKQMVKKPHQHLCQMMTELGNTGNENMTSMSSKTGQNRCHQWAGMSQKA